MAVINFEKAFLKDNPFAGTPAGPGEEIIWAAMTAPKEQIRNRILNSLATSPYSLILNWGPWGGGKTHAAKYFTQQKVLSELSKQAAVPPPLSHVVTIPRNAKDIVRDIYLALMSYLGIQRIGEDLSRVAENLGERFDPLVRTYTGDEELAQSLLMLSGRKTVGKGKQDNLLPEDAGQISTELRRYFLLSAANPELNALGLVRKIENSNDQIKVLSAIYNLLLYSKEVTPLYSEIIIWFDEVEEILSLPGKQQVILTGLIRDFTDYIPSNLTMFLNFTPRTGGRFEDLSAYLSSAVVDRVRDQIYFNYFDENQIKQYISELLNNPKYRLPGLKKNQANLYFPFTADAVEILTELLMSKATPRTINDICSLVIERALASGLLENPDSPISSEFVRAMEGEINSITTRGKISPR